jgi:hypothetical protein
MQMHTNHNPSNYRHEDSSVNTWKLQLLFVPTHALIHFKTSTHVNI